MLSIGLVGLIVMSTVLQAQSFEAAKLNREASALEIQQQSLTREVETAPQPGQRGAPRTGLRHGAQHQPRLPPAVRRQGARQARTRHPWQQHQVGVADDRARTGLPQAAAVLPGHRGRDLRRSSPSGCSRSRASTPARTPRRPSRPAPPRAPCRRLAAQILDRNGVALATSVDGLTLTADPTMTSENAPRIARLLVEELGDKIDYFETIDKLRTPNSHFVYLKRDVPAWTATKTLKAISDAGFTGVFSEKESLRTLPGRQARGQPARLHERDRQGRRRHRAAVRRHPHRHRRLQHVRGLADRSAHPDGRQHRHRDGAGPRRDDHDRP